MTTPWSIIFHKNVRRFIVNDIIPVFAYENFDGTIVGCRNWLRLQILINISINDVICKFSNLLNGEILWADITLVFLHITSWQNCSERWEVIIGYSKEFTDSFLDAFRNIEVCEKDLTLVYFSRLKVCLHEIWLSLLSKFSPGETKKTSVEWSEKQEDWLLAAKDFLCIFISEFKRGGHHQCLSPFGELILIG
jgi:hypothetical protein